MAQPIDVGKTVDALRATRELDVNLSGIQALRAAVAGPHVPAHLAAYLRASPACAELAGIWEAQLAIKDARILPQLLLLIADIISYQLPEEAAVAAAAAGHTGLPERLAAAQQALIEQVLQRRLKQLYHALGSEARHMVNGALALLEAVAGHSAPAARDLVACFDFSLAALARAARPPRPKGRGEAGSGTAADDADARSALRHAWRQANPLSRPSRALFVGLARALLRVADSATLAQVVQVRALMGGLLNHLAADPPAEVVHTLRALAAGALGAGSGAGLPPRLHAEPFGDTALQQLAEVAGLSDELPADGTPDSEDDEASLALAAAAAYEMLEMLVTDPAHGLVTRAPVAAVPDAAEPATSAAGSSGAQFGPGVKRVLRLLPKLQPLDRLRHAQLLQALADRLPWLAAEFVSSMPYALEPKVSGRWVAAMALVCRLLPSAAAAVLPLAARIDRLVAAAASGGGAAGALGPLPGVDSPLVRSHLRCCLPPALSKVVLSRGVQHSSLLVQHQSLEALQLMLGNIAPLLQALLEGAAAAAMAGNAAAAAQWLLLVRRMRAAVRARLPDLQALLAVHSALEAACQAAAGSSAAPATASMVEVPTKAAAELRQAKGGGGDVVMAEAAEAAADAKGAGAGAGDEEEDEEEDVAELEAAVFGNEKDPRVRSCQVLVRLLRVIASMCLCLPESVTDAHFDLVKLLPQDVLAVSDDLQQALLDVLSAATGPTAASAPHTTGEARAPFFGGQQQQQQLSTALVMPLLRLLMRARDARVRQLAGELLLARMQAAGAFDLLLEPSLWLWSLPCTVPTAGVDVASQPAEQHSAAADEPAAAGGAAADNARCLEAVAAFLCDLLVSYSRRPNEGFELMHTLLPARPGALHQGAAAVLTPAPTAVSPLAALALRNCLKLLRSQKAGPLERAAVCCYVSGVLHQLMQQQGNAHMLAAMLQQALLMDAAAAAVAAGHHNPQSQPAPSSPGRVTLPAEGRPLQSLHEWALLHCAATRPGAPGGDYEGRPTKRRKTAAQFDEGGAACTPAHSFGLIDLEVAIAAGGDGDQGSSHGDEGDASSRPEGGQRAALKKLRRLIKQAAAAMAADGAAQGGAPQVGPDSCATLHAAAPTALLLLGCLCADGEEACQHAAELLVLARTKAAAAAHAAASRGGENAAAAHAAAALVRALWEYVLAAPLAGRCVLPGQGALGEDEAWRCFSEAVVGPARARSGLGVVAPMMRLQLWQAALSTEVPSLSGIEAQGASATPLLPLQQLLLLQSPQPPALAAGQRPSSGLQGQPASAALALAAAALHTAPFWLQQVRWAGSRKSVARCYSLLLQLLPVAAAAAMPADARGQALLAGAVCNVLTSQPVAQAITRGSIATSEANGISITSRSAAKGSGSSSSRAKSAAAAEQGALQLVHWVLEALQTAASAAVTPEGASGPLGCRGKLAAALPNAAARAAVRTACEAHVAAALDSAAALLRGLPGQGGGGGSGGGADASSAGRQAERLPLLLPVLAHAPAAQLQQLALSMLELGLLQTDTRAGASGASTKRVSSAHSSKDQKQQQQGGGPLDAAAGALGQAGGTTWLLQQALQLAAAALGGGAGGQQDDGAWQAGSSGSLAVRLFGRVQQAVAVCCRGGAQEGCVALRALAACLTGPRRQLLLAAVEPPTLGACLDLLAHEPAAGQCLEAAMGQGRDAMREVLRKRLPAALEAAAGSQVAAAGAGRRIALARLLPAANAYLSDLEADAASAAAAGAVPDAEGPSLDSDEDMMHDSGREGVAVSDRPSVSDAPSDPVLLAYREPLLAYAMRKRRKAGGSGAEADMPADALALLRLHAAPALRCILRLAPPEDAEAYRKLLAKLVPEAGGSYSLRDDPTQPVASPVQQLDLAMAVVRQAVAATGVRGQQLLELLLLPLSAATATLCALYESGTLPLHLQQQKKDDMDVSQQANHQGAKLALLQQVLRALDGSSGLGDMLSELPDSLRATPAFGRVCAAVAHLGAATALHAGGDVAAVRCLRRLTAALLPSALGGAKGEEEEGAACEGAQSGANAEVGEQVGVGVAKQPDSGGESSSGDGDDASRDQSSDGIDDDDDMLMAEGGGSGSVGSSDQEASSSDDGTDGGKSQREREDGDSSDGSDHSDGSDVSVPDDDDEDAGHDGDGAAAAVDPDEDEEKEEEESEQQKGDGEGQHEVAAGEPGGTSAARHHAQQQEDEEEALAASAAGGLPAWGLVPNAAAEAAAGEMLDALLRSQALAAALAPAEPGAGLDASGAGIGGGDTGGAVDMAVTVKEALGRVLLPLSSLMAVADVAGDLLAPAGATMGWGLSGDVPLQPAHEGPAGGFGSREELRQEVAMLLETLIDMRLAFECARSGAGGAGAANGRGGTSSSSSDDVDEEDGTDGDGGGGQGLAGGGPRPNFGREAREQQVLSALLQLLQCSYSATLGGADRAVLRVMLRLDWLLLQAADAGAGGASSALACRLNGPLGRSGFVWGAAAAALYSGAALSQDAMGAGAAGRPTERQLATQSRARALNQHAALDPRAAALACVLLPPGRTLSADEDNPWVSSASSGGSSTPQPGLSAVAAYAYDPAWLLPFAAACLRDGAATVGDLAAWGVMALCVRCLACHDAGLRALAYEVLELAARQLEDIAVAAAAASLERSGHAPAVDASRRLGEDFRQRPLLAALVAALRAAAAAAAGGSRVRRPQQAHVCALFAAEACFGLLQTQAPMHKLLAKLISRNPCLDLGGLPLFRRLLACGAPGQRQQQVWALKLLRWGALGRLDASLCRGKFAPEVVLALQGSAALGLGAPSGAAAQHGQQEAAGGSGGAAWAPSALLPLRCVCALAALPSLARHMVLHAGLVPWLAQAAVDAPQDISSISGGASPAAAQALSCLLGLVGRRVCMRRQDPPAAVAQYAQAAAQLAAAAAARRSAPLAAAACRLVRGLCMAVPPWRLAALWQQLPPALLLQLHGLLAPGAPLQGPQQQHAAAAGLSLWLQAVVLSQPLPQAPPPGLLLLPSPLLPQPQHPGGVDRTSNSRERGVEQLAHAAVRAALQLVRCREGSQEPVQSGPGPGGVALAQACLLWCASLAAAGSTALTASLSESLPEALAQLRELACRARPGGEGHGDALLRAALHRACAMWASPAACCDGGARAAAPWLGACAALLGCSPRLGALLAEALAGMAPAAHGAAAGR